MYIGRHTKYHLLLSDFKETLIFSTHAQNIIKFHENPSSESSIVPCGHTDERTDMTKLIVAFRNFVNAPKNQDIKA